MARGFIISVVMALLAGPAACCACSVPVFRYALERWRADRFSGVVFVDRKLNEAQDELLASIVRAADAPAGGVNLVVERVDVSGSIPKKYSLLWKEQKETAGSKLPWLVIRYPALVGDDQKVMWAGPLESAEVAAMFHSPAREELGKRLMKGEALVFVLVDSGKKEVDETAARVIAEQIPVLEKTVKVSKVLEDDPLVEGPTLKSNLPVKLEMSVMRVSRADPAERMFVRMLMRSQSEAIGEDVPVVFPVFGRGRILCALAGKAIVAGNLEDAATFLAGPCSCQVKELNPGIDILMAADWDSVVEGREAVVARVGRINIPEPKIAVGPASRPMVTVATTQTSWGSYHVSSNGDGATSIIVGLNGRGMLIVGIAVTSAVVLVLGFLLVRQRRTGR